MDETTDDELGDALRDASDDAAFEQRPSTVAVAAALRSRSSGPADDRAVLAAALEYRCSAAVGRNHPRVLALWARAHALAPRPLLAARFADLLWTTRYGESPPEWARRAVDAYLAAVFDRFGHVLEIDEGLQRALAIAGDIDDHPRRVAVIAALAGLADRSLASEEPSPGLTLSIIELLAALPVDDRPRELDALIERAIDRYHDDPWLLEPALDAKARLADRDDHARLRRAQIDAFADRARRSPALLRHAHFEHAIELAERHELTEVAVALRAELDPSSVEFEAPGDSAAAPADDPTGGNAETELAPDPILAFVERIVGDDGWEPALVRFGACLPTEGNTTDAEDEGERLSFFGGVAAMILGRMRERYGALDPAGRWFECALIDAAVAERVAHAGRLFEAGDFAASESVLAPRLEHIVRELACAARVGAVDAPELSELFVALEGSLYEPSRRYLRMLLAQMHGPLAATADDAALLVHAACHLRLMQRVEAVAPQ